MGEGKAVLISIAVIAWNLFLLFLSFDSQAQTVNICGRTSQIRTAILEELGPSVTNCATVTSAQLATVEGIYTRQRNITSLKPGDFSGLSNLKKLNLAANSLSSLDEDLFDGLTNLEHLDLGYNSLVSLPVDLFDGLTNLTHLCLNVNRLDSLDKDLFDGLIKLEELWLYNNSLDSLDKDLFDGLTSLKLLDLSINSLDSLDEDLFNGLTSLEELILDTNSLASLPADLFDGLIKLEALFLGRNSLASLPEDLFDGLTSLWALGLSFNSLDRLHKDLFDGLASLKSLDLEANSLDSLEEDLFDGLTNLEYLWLEYNSLTSLPKNLFDHVKSPQALMVDLRGNLIPCFPEAIVNNDAVKLRHPNSSKICGIFAAVLSLSPASISENGDRTVVTATLDQTPGTDITITVSAVPQAPASTSDYMLSPDTTLTIAAGQMTSTGMVTITAVDNDVEAPDKMITVRGTATSTERVIGPADVTLTITDDDAEVTLLLSPVSISENGGSTTVTAMLNQALSSDITITVSAVPQAPASASDYRLSPNTTLTIAAGQMTSTGMVTITAIDNDVNALDKMITVRGTATSTERVIGPADVTLTITDDDAIPTVTLSLSPASISENGGSTTVTATLDRPSGAATTITVSAAPQAPATSSDYTLSPNAMLTIAAGQTTSTGGGHHHGGGQ